MKLIVAVVAMLAAFWAGYGLCAYRYNAVLLPEITRSGGASDASILMRSIGLIDKGEVPAVRAKLFAVADAKLNSSMPAPGFNWRSFLTGPLESMDEPREFTRQKAEEAAAVRAEMKQLCQSPPQSDTYRTICSR